MEEARHYCAFISYRHKDLDKSVAKKLHSMIERYTVPAELRKTWGSKRLGKVFRDEEELPVSSNLTESITAALDHTDYLIVICTPDTPESEWVEREICYFLSNHDRSHVIAVLANGTPETSFPKHLTSDFDEKGNVIADYEPLAANLTGVDHRFRKSRMGKEAVRLYAAIMGCHFDSLWQREKRHNLKCVLALMALIITVVACYSISIARKNVMISDANEALSVQIETVQRQSALLERSNLEIEGQKQHILSQKEELQKQYDEIREINRELNEKEADTLLREGELLLEKGDVEGAKRRAVEAIASEEGRSKYSDEARFLLSRAFSEGHYDNYMRTTAVVEQDDDIFDMCFSQDRKYLYTMDVRGYVRAFSTADGSLIWKGNSGSFISHNYVTDRKRLIEIPEEHILLCQNEDAVSALSLEDGSQKWCYTFQSMFSTDFCVLSPDFSQIALIEAASGFEKMEPKAVLLNTADGSVKKEFSLKNAFGDSSIIASGRQCGIFLPDGNSVVGVLYSNDSLFTYDDTFVFKIDFNKGKVKIFDHKTLGEDEAIMPEYYHFTLGVEYYKSEEEESFTIFCFDALGKKIMARQFGLDGKILLEYEYPLNLNSRSINGLYRTSFHRVGDQVLFSCGKTSFRYLLSEQRFLEIGSGYNEEILNSACLDSDQDLFSYLTSDGKQFLLWNSGGKAIYDFSDKTQLENLVISDGFGYSEKGEFGYELSSDAVEAVIRKGESKRAYLLRPDRGPGIRQTEWFADRDLAGISYSASLAELKSGEIVLYSDHEADDILNVTVTDPVSDQVLHTYEFDYSNADGITSFTGQKIKYALWPDQKHLTFCSETKCVVCDLEKNEYQNLLGEKGIAVADLLVLENGDVLSAAVCETADSTFTDPKYEVRYAIGAESVHSVPIPEGKAPMKKFSSFRQKNIFCEGDGMILIPLTEVKGDMPVSYMRIDTKDGSSDIFSGTELLSSKGILCLGRNSDRIMTVDQEDRLVLLDPDKDQSVLTIETPFTSEDIASCGFLHDERTLYIWTKSRILYIYDIETGNVLMEQMISWEKSSGIDEPTMICYEDPEKKYVFFVTDQKEVLMVNSSSWKVLSEFTGCGIYSTRSGEVFRIKNDGMKFGEEMADLIRFKVYNLEELEQMGRPAEEK